MCDTLTVTPTASADGIALFAKNSDREPNEAHEIVLLPAMDFAAGSRVRCTYNRDRSGAAHLRGGAGQALHHLGCGDGGQRAWRGHRQRGGVYQGAIRQEGCLTGMGLLRLGLERATTARAALAVMIALLDQHGQGGNCGFAHQLYYHNSFLVADPHEAWVWQTATTSSTRT